MPVYGNEAAVQRHAVGDRRHAELAHAEIDDSCRRPSRLTAFAARPDGQIRCPSGRPSRRSVPAAPAPAPRCAFCEALRVAMVSALALAARSRPRNAARQAGGQLAGHAALEFARRARDAPRRRRRNCVVPFAFARRALARARPSRRRSLPEFRTADDCQPMAARVAAISSVAERARRAYPPMPCFVRRALADDGLAADQARPVGYRLRLLRARRRSRRRRGRRRRGSRASRRPRSASACRR